MSEIIATAEKLEGSRMRISVEVSPADLQTEYRRAVQRVSRRVKISGFRPGKAPRQLVENSVGVATVMQDMLEVVVPRAYTLALEETGVTPVDQPELDISDPPSLDVPFLFSAEVAVAPTVVLGDISDVVIDVPDTSVTPEQIESEIEQLRTSQSAWDLTDRVAASGDMVQTRMRISAAGVDPEDSQPYNVIVGENGFPEGFDDAVIGKSAGDQVFYEAGIPANDPNETLRGKDVTFEIDVDGVSERRLPELDDEFARSVGPFDDLDALRTRVDESLCERKAHEAQHQTEDGAVEALVGRATFDIAEVLVDRERDQVVKDRTQALVNQGVAVDTYLAMRGETRESWDEEARDEALRRIRRSLALEQYADVEGIEVDTEETEEEIERVVAHYPEERRNLVRSNLIRDESRSQVENTVRSRKALGKLVEKVAGGVVWPHHHDGPPPELASVAQSEEEVLPDAGNAEAHEETEPERTD
jgi:trigger factor